MDMNLHKLTNNTWSLDHHMTIDQEQDPNTPILVHNQHAHYSNWHNNYPLQPHELPSSSSHHHQLLFEDHDHPHQMGSSSKNINHVFEQEVQEDQEEEQEEELGAMKEMMYKIASMQPVDIDPSTIRKPKRRNVRISEDPQSVAARLRRERISEKIRILQRLVPGGTKMDTASMLDEAIRYVKFLKRQIRVLQSTNHHHPHGGTGLSSNNQDWSWLPITTSNKNVALEDQVGFSFTVGGINNGDGNETLCFNDHHEVI